MLAGLLNDLKINHSGELVASLRGLLFARFKCAIQMPMLGRD